MTLILAATAALSIGGWADTTLTITRLRYEGGGDWYANPSSLPNLLAAIRDPNGSSGRRARGRRSACLIPR